MNLLNSGLHQRHRRPGARTALGTLGAAAQSADAAVGMAEATEVEMMEVRKSAHPLLKVN